MVQVNNLCDVELKGVFSAKLKTQSIYICLPLQIYKSRLSEQKLLKETGGNVKKILFFSLFVP